jgi:phospholipase/carboxylesterase
MNRLSAAPSLPHNHAQEKQAHDSHAQAVARVKRPALKRSGGDLPYCLLAPLHYEANYAYPLVVWLHGPEGSERELSRVMPHISLRNYAASAARGTAEAFRGFDWEQTPTAIVAAEQRVADAVERACERFHVHRERIFLCGAESGGTMAIRLALRNPERYAGAVSLGGPFPEGHRPLVKLEQARKSRLLIAHCRDSESYSLDQLCQELALFHAAGMSVTLRQYPCPDELTTQMLSDADIWMMEQITGTVHAEDHAAPLPSDWN